MTHSVLTNFRLELIEPSAREDEGDRFFFSSDAVSGLIRFESCPLQTEGSIGARRKLVYVYQNNFLDCHKVL